MAFVNIVTSDRGWILEKLAREISDRLPYVTFGNGPDPSADIQYYITYSSRRQRLSPVEVACFTHLEPEGDARDRFFDTARDVEFCICQSKLYEGVLREAGLTRLTTISPGVDLETFRPKLKIGVVGRTYHTGRKGEHVVAQVMDIPEIEWSFTGEGWPGEALSLPGDQLPDYYRSLDYVLVPALYEGGPMCVLEALAVGTEIIGPAIGWVPEFPHVEYTVGDAADLRRVLLELVEKKRNLRSTVLDRTWESWSEGHDRVFQDLAKQHGLTLSRPHARTTVAPRPQRVGVFMHGNENRAQGGPSVRVPRLAKELRENGTGAELRIHPAPNGFDGIDVVHAFNSWSPWSGLDLLRRANRAGKAVVFSPILLDLSLKDLWEDRLVQILAQAEPGAGLDAALEGFADALARRRRPDAPIAETVPGFRAAVQEMVSLSDHVVLLSERERQRLARMGAVPAAGTVVPNPVDAAIFSGADPALFEAETGLKDFVLCVARIESRKNQALLAHALRDTGLPLVLIGHAPNAAYRALLERHRTANVHVLNRLPPNSPLLASAFAASRVAVLPSWAEGAPLSALEAAASGANLVLSDESGESEYFGDLARYCDPGDPAAMRRAILEAYETRRDPAAIEAQKALIADRFSWERHREGTQAVYGKALATAAARVGSAPAAQAPAAHSPAAQAPAPPAIRTGTPAVAARPVTIVYDVTSSANHSGRWTGIARVEAALALALKGNPRAKIRFVAWNNKARQFIEVPFEGIRAGKLSRFLAHYDTNPAPLLSLPEGAHLVVPGSGWMQNSLYAESVVAFARRHRLRLAPIIHDIIPTKFPFWFNDGYAPVFEQNLTLLLDGASHVLAISQATRRDVEEYAARIQGLFIPGISTFREGDEIQQIAGGGEEAAHLQIQQQFSQRPFVLTVGAIHQRKNHKLLYDAWLKLRERMGARCPRLVIVGGVAWNGHDVARALRGDARLKDWVTILEGVDDEALDWLYRNCLFTVYPSLYEGWGLPVAESLRYGKLCLASDTSSVPEIAPGLVELIDPLDVARWVTKIQFYAGSQKARASAEQRIAEGYTGFTWARSGDQFLDVLTAAEAQPPKPSSYILGTTVKLGDRIAASRHRGPGWHPLEKWGCWASSTRSTLVFDPALPIDGPLVFVAEARAQALPGTLFEARILANGVPVSRWSLRGSNLQVLHAIIPAEIAAQAATVTIEIESTSLTPLRLVTKSDDPRLIGIGIAQATLASLSTVRDVARYFGDATPDRKRVTLGYGYNLLRDAVGRAFLDGNWMAHPAWGMYSVEQRPRLSMVLQDLPGQDLDLELRLRPVATRGSGFSLFAIANGVEIGAASFESDEPRCVSFTLPAAVRAMAEPVTIDLVASDARAPSEFGLGEPTDPFSFGIISLALHARDDTRSQARLPLVPGRPLHLHPSGDKQADSLLHLALGGDWHTPEATATWSFGRSGLLPLQLSGELRRGVLLTADVTLARPARDAVQGPLEVWVGDRLLASQRLTPLRPGSVEITVPPAAIGEQGELDLRFTIGATGSAAPAAGLADERPLGIRISQIRSAALPVLEKDKVVVFRSDPETEASYSDAAELLRGTWFRAERSGRWSRGDGGGLAFVADPALGPDWRFYVFGRALIEAPGATSVIDLELGGEVLNRWELTADRSTVLEVTGISGQVAPGSFASLVFRSHGQKSPFELGLGRDTRLLGLQLAAALITDGDTPEQEVRDLFAAALSRPHAAEPAPAKPAPAKPAPAEPAPAAPIPAPPVLAPLPAPIAETEPAATGEDQPGEHQPGGTPHPTAAETALSEAAALDPLADIAPPPPEPSPEETEREPPPPEPVLASLFDFSADGDVAELGLSGWHPAEADGRWSVASLAEVMLPVPPEATGEVQVEIFGRVFGTAARGAAEVQLTLDHGAPVDWTFESDDFVKKTARFPIQVAMVGHTVSRLSLTRTNAVSPADVGQGDDERKLGLLVQMLRVTWY